MLRKLSFVSLLRSRTATCVALLIASAQAMRTPAFSTFHQPPSAAACESRSLFAASHVRGRCSRVADVRMQQVTQMAGAAKRVPSLLPLSLGRPCLISVLNDRSSGKTYLPLNTDYVQFQAAAAVMEEVSRSVGTNGIEAPDMADTFVSIDAERTGLVDEEGLPLVYDKQAIQKYWEGQGGALQQRWIEFLSVSVPFLTRVATLLVSGGADALQANSAGLAKDARERIEKLGPTYVKMGQMMSVRPDVLPQEALNELVALQERARRTRAHATHARARDALVRAFAAPGRSRTYSDPRTRSLALTRALAHARYGNACALVGDAGSHTLREHVLDPPPLPPILLRVPRTCCSSNF
eukprot:257091-Pleurochrysis_carterae.AAC.12